MSAVDFNGTEVDEIEDHRFSDTDMEKINQEYEVFEVDEDSTFNIKEHGVENRTTYTTSYGQTQEHKIYNEYDFDITIKNKIYHEEKSQIVDGKSYKFNPINIDLELGYNILDLIHYTEKDYNGNYKKVCVILHGYNIINTDEPVYKTVTIKSNKKVISHYKKIPHYKTFKSWDFAKSPKKLKSMIKWRCRNGEFECCASGTTKLVKFYQKQLYKHGAKLVKFKIKRLSKYKYSPQAGYKTAKFKFSVKVKYYSLKPVYKTVTVESSQKVFSHYKKIGEIW